MGSPRERIAIRLRVVIFCLAGLALSDLGFSGLLAVIRCSRLLVATSFLNRLLRKNGFLVRWVYSETNRHQQLYHHNRSLQPNRQTELNRYSFSIAPAFKTESDHFLWFQQPIPEQTSAGCIGLGRSAAQEAIAISNGSPSTTTHCHTRFKEDPR